MDDKEVNFMNDVGYHTTKLEYKAIDVLDRLVHLGGTDGLKEALLASEKMYCDKGAYGYGLGTCAAINDLTTENGITLGAEIKHSQIEYGALEALKYSARRLGLTILGDNGAVASKVLCDLNEDASPACDAVNDYIVEHGLSAEMPAVKTNVTRR